MGARYGGWASEPAAGHFTRWIVEASDSAAPSLNDPNYERRFVYGNQFTLGQDDSDTARWAHRVTRLGPGSRGGRIRLGSGIEGAGHTPADDPRPVWVQYNLGSSWLQTLLHSGRALVTLVFVLAVALVACGGGQASGPVAVESVTFMRDDGGKPGAVTTSFKPSDHILHAQAKLNQTTTGFNGKVVWVAVETEGGNGVTIAETNVSGLAANTITGKVELPRDWPIGKYRVDFYQGDTLLKSGEFTVAA